MPLDPREVSAAMRNGLSAVCATCDKYWNARDQKVPDGRCLSTDGCGSPIAGDDFHEYSGPLGSLEKICFVCGGTPKGVVRARGKLRLVGICEGHIPMLRELRPKNAYKIPEGLPSVFGASGAIDLEKIGLRKKTLFEEIVEAETYFREQEAKGKRG